VVDWTIAIPVCIQREKRGQPTIPSAGFESCPKPALAALAALAALGICWSVTRVHLHSPQVGQGVASAGEGIGKGSNWMTGKKERGKVGH
jgi:hypothetical protein